MSGRVLAGLFCLIGLLLSLAGCRGENTTSTTAAEVTRLRVYFLLEGKVQPVLRVVPTSPAITQAALERLVEGPSTTEREIGLRTTLGPDANARSLTVENGVASVEIVGTYDRAALAQVVFTLTQFPTIKTVVIGGKRYGRADFEGYTPQILVESPLRSETVSNPIHATGTANTFEATFQYELIGPDGDVLDTHHVTATSGTGQRGTFDFRTAPYGDISGDGALVVFELSAKDGSRIHETRIPVHLAR